MGEGKSSLEIGIRFDTQQCLQNLWLARIQIDPSSYGYITGTIVTTSLREMIPVLIHDYICLGV